MGTFDITENPFTEHDAEGEGGNEYVMETKGTGEGGLHYENKGVEYTFSETMYEPYEADTPAAPPGVDVEFGPEIKKNLAAADEKEEPDIKKDLAAVDMEETSETTHF